MMATFDDCVYSVTGSVPVNRRQKQVTVNGHIRGYSPRQKSPFECVCLLAPQIHGRSPKYLCHDDCPVVVARRTYIDCTELEVVNSLVHPLILGDRVTDPKTVRPDGVRVEETLSDRWIGDTSWTEWQPPSPGSEMDEDEDEIGDDEEVDDDEEGGGGGGWGEEAEEMGWGIGLNGLNNGWGDEPAGDQEPWGGGWEQ